MSFADFPLNGKIVVVTGGGSGINLTFARAAIHQGAHVIIADLKLTDEGATFVEGEGAVNAIFLRCDVTKRADLENIIKISEEKYKDVPDVYIAGAGVFEPSWSNFWDDTEDDTYAQVNINLNHPLKLSRIAIRALLQRNKKGVILITTSVAGYAGTLSAPLYCATKHGIVGFVRSMAELAELEGIKVCAVAPGLVRTPLWTDYPEKMKQFGYSEASTITPDEVAKAMVDLITNGKYGGGTCLEVTLRGTRILGTWNIDPPAYRGPAVPEEAANLRKAPILAILNKERNSSGANLD